VGETEGSIQAHDVVKRGLKELLVLSNPSPGGEAFPTSSVLIEPPPHLRGDISRPGDVLALGRDVHRMDTAMDIVIALDAYLLHAKAPIMFLKLRKGPSLERRENRLNKSHYPLRCALSLWL